MTGSSSSSSHSVLVPGQPQQQAQAADKAAVANPSAGAAAGGGQAWLAPTVQPKAQATQTAGVQVAADPSGPPAAAAPSSLLNKQPNMPAAQPAFGFPPKPMGYPMAPNPGMTAPGWFPGMMMYPYQMQMPMAPGMYPMDMYSMAASMMYQQQAMQQQMLMQQQVAAGMFSKQPGMGMGQQQQQGAPGGMPHVGLPGMQGQMAGQMSMALQQQQQQQHLHAMQQQQHQAALQQQQSQQAGLVPVVPPAVEPISLPGAEDPMQHSPPHSDTLMSLMSFQDVSSGGQVQGSGEAAVDQVQRHVAEDSAELDNSLHLSIAPRCSAEAAAPAVQPQPQQQQVAKGQQAGAGGCTATPTSASSSITTSTAPCPPPPPIPCPPPPPINRRDPPKRTAPPPPKSSGSLSRQSSQALPTSPRNGTHPAAASINLRSKSKTVTRSHTPKREPDSRQDTSGAIGRADSTAALAALGVTATPDAQGRVPLPALIRSCSVPAMAIKSDDGGDASEGPVVYVSVKRAAAILRRREQRARLEAAGHLLTVSARSRKPYMHQSRHDHAQRRIRGPGGRFLSAQEQAALLQQTQGTTSTGGDELPSVSAPHGAHSTANSAPPLSAPSPITTTSNARRNRAARKPPARDESIVSAPPGFGAAGGGDAGGRSQSSVRAKRVAVKSRPDSPNSLTELDDDHHSLLRAASDSMLAMDGLSAGPSSHASCLHRSGSSTLSAAAKARKSHHKKSASSASQPCSTPKGSAGAGAGPVPAGSTLDSNPALAPLELSHLVGEPTALMRDGLLLPPRPAFAGAAHPEVDEDGDDELLLMMAGDLMADIWGPGGGSLLPGEAHDLPHTGSGAAEHVQGDVDMANTGQPDQQGGAVQRHGAGKGPMLHASDCQEPGLPG